MDNASSFAIIPSAFTSKVQLMGRTWKNSWHKKILKYVSLNMSTLERAS